jgi:hypothetical protein
LLARLATAYCAGRSVPYQPERISANDPYWDLVDAVQAAHVPVGERLVFRRCRTAIAEGLKHARHGRLASAAQLFAEARQLVTGAGRSEEVRFLGRAVLLAAEAYVSYRQRRYDLARQQVHEAMDLDLLLENDYGYNILHLHRINLIHNLARITAKEEGPERAMGPLVDLLLYLQGARPHLEALVPGKGGVEAAPPDLVRAVTYAYASDLVVLWSSLEPARAAPLFSVLEPITLERDAPRFQPRIASAFRLKGMRPGRPRAGHLGAIVPALAEGRSEAPRLWYSLVVDLARLLAGAPEPGAKELCGEMVRDAADWPDLPPALRPWLPETAAQAAPPV